MSITLPFPLSIQEMRVLQEYRRIGADTLPLETITAIRHPSGGGEAPLLSLADKGYVTSTDQKTFTLTEKAKAFLAIDAKPADEAGGSAADPS